MLAISLLLVRYAVGKVKKHAMGTICIRIIIQKMEKVKKKPVSRQGYFLQ